MAELVQIQGVGEGKAKKYGQPFLNLIKRYVEDNDITPPQELTVKSTLATAFVAVVYLSALFALLMNNNPCKLFLQ